MKQVVLLISDIIVLYGALALALLLRYQGKFGAQWYVHVVPFTILFVFWLTIFFITNLYDTRTLRNTPAFYSTLLRTIAIASILSVTFFYLIPYFRITPKTTLLFFIIIFSATAAGSRTLYNALIGTRFKKSAVIVGTNPQALELAQFVRENPQLGWRLNSVINTGSNLDALRYALTQKQIDTVVVSPEAYQMQELIDVFYKSLNQRIAFRNLSSFYEQLTGRVPLGAINQIWFLENLTENTKRFYEMTKRAVDIVLAALLGLPVLVASPFIALAVTLDSPGPILYHQRRLGRAGSTFQIIKFRTMRKDAEQQTGAVWAQDNDPRVTRLGRFLRKTRIDELPQLWNIVKGEMSFVGPRAERPEFYEMLKKSVPFYEERYLINPGLTGWAQINYRYGSSIQDAAEKLQYDLYYIKNRSLILDFGIILKTINIAMRQGGR